MLKKLLLGIIASIVGGGILIVGGVIVENLSVPQNMGPESELKVEATRVVKSISDGVQKKPQIESEIEDLQELVRVAREIYSSSSRDKEYSKIIDQALSERKPEFAFTVAKNIYYATSRDREYSKIISQCISLDRYDLAIKVAGEMYYSTSRDKEYKKIIEAGRAKRRGSSFSK